MAEKNVQGVIPQKLKQLRYFALLGALAVALMPCTALANQAPIVDTLAASATRVLPEGAITVTVDAHDPDCPNVCTSGCGKRIRADRTDWRATGGTFPSEDPGTSGSPYHASAEWKAPLTEGTYTITVYLSDSGSFMCGGRRSTTASIDFCRRSRSTSSLREALKVARTFSLLYF